MKISRTASAVALAAAGLLLSPFPATAATCPTGMHWVDLGGAMGGTCSYDASGGVGSGSGSGTFDGGGSDTTGQAPPAPVYQAPPAPIYQAPVYSKAPVYQAPMPQAPVVNPVPALPHANQAAPFVPRKGVDQAPPGIQKYGPAVASEEEAAASPAPTVTPTPRPSATPTPTATPTETAAPSLSPLPSMAAGQASSAQPFNPVTLVFILGGVMIAAALALLVRPARAALARAADRKADS